MGFILIVAEKPLQAKAIAKALLQYSTVHEDYIEGTTADSELVRVSSFQGRTVDHYEPQHYHPKWGKPWRLEALPFFPPESQWKFRVIQPEALRRIDRLRSEASEIVNACDAGRQGEFIFWSSMRHLGWTPKQKLTTRMWITDPSRNGLARSFADRKKAETKKYLRSLNAAYAQWMADYIFGINMSRYVTLTLPAYGTLGHPAYSIGRVKTPTINLVQTRVKQIEAFVSERFYQLNCEFYSEKGNYFATVLAEDGMKFKFDNLRFRTYEDLMGVKVAIASCSKEWLVFDSEEQKPEYPLPPFNTLELQRVAYRTLGWTSKHTMRAAQELYEIDGAITYPRTDSDTIPPGLKGDVLRIFQQTWEAMESVYPKLRDLGGPMPIDCPYFDEQKSDHHAIIPTGVVPLRDDKNGLKRDAYLLWDLITRRFVTSLCPPAQIRACSRRLEVTLPDTDITVRALLTAAPVSVPNWLLVETPWATRGV